MTNLLRFDFKDHDGVVEVVENGDWVRATDYDALAAKLAEVTAERDDALIALASARKQLERYVGETEAALPAVYRLALADAADRIDDFNTLPADENGHRWRESDLLDQEVMSIRSLPTPTAEELMARIKETGQ